MDKKRISCWVAKIKIRSLSPTPLSKIRNCSPAFVTWYLSGNTGISSLRRGVGGKSLFFCCEWIVRFRLLTCGRLTAAVSEIFSRTASRICWGVSCVAYFRFVDAFIFVTLIWSCDGGWVCSLISQTNSPFTWSFTFALHCPLRRSTHFQKWRLFDSSFWKTYGKPFRINILAPLSDVVNSILTSVM